MNSYSSSPLNLHKPRPEGYQHPSHQLIHHTVCLDKSFSSVSSYRMAQMMIRGPCSLQQFLWNCLKRPSYELAGIRQTMKEIYLTVTKLINLFHYSENQGTLLVVFYRETEDRGAKVSKDPPLSFYPWSVNTATPPIP